MKRLALALVGLGAVAAAASAQGNLNCDRDYQAFWAKMAPAGAKMTAKQLADINRVAVRGYDACTAGDQRFNTKDFFDKLSPAGARPEDIFKQIDQQGINAKK